MDDFDVQGKERELDELLSEVKSLLEEDRPLREDPMEGAGLQDEASEGPMTADDVNIDFEKFYDGAAGFPDEASTRRRLPTSSPKAPIRWRAGRSMSACGRRSARQETASVWRATAKKSG